jgi:hypothetical protein
MAQRTKLLLIGCVPPMVLVAMVVALWLISAMNPRIPLLAFIPYILVVMALVGGFIIWVGSRPSNTDGHD